MIAFCIIFDLLIAYRYLICDVFHWFCKIARFFATEPKIVCLVNGHSNHVHLQYHGTRGKSLSVAKIKYYGNQSAL
jgi:hypothetical protein